MAADSSDDEASAIEHVLRRSSSSNGDDAAVLRFGGGMACVSTDSTIEGVHAPAGTTPHALGRRAAGRALSDLAAMGALPAGLTCAVHVPAGRWTDAVRAVDGVIDRGIEQDAPLVGGDFTHTPGGPIGIVVTVLGRRSGAHRGGFAMRSANVRDGDELHVTGTLGVAARALSRSATVLPEPPDRLRAGSVLARFAHAMIDISDGLSSDAPSLLHRSGLGALVELDKLPVADGVDPVTAAWFGDDYELLVAVSPDRSAAAIAALGTACPTLRLTRIGRVTDAGSRVRFTHAGAPVDVPRGFVHR